MLSFMKDIDVAGYTLIMPSVSVGNVGQFATDLLISTLMPKKAGVVYHRSIFGLVGPDAFRDDGEGLTTCCEVFVESSKKLVILQLRAPLLQESSHDFFIQLINWIKNSEIERAVILCSSHAFMMNDEQINDVPFRYLGCKKILESEGETFRKLQWKPLERREYPAPAKIDPNYVSPEWKLSLRIPGGGFAKKFYDLCDIADITVAVLIHFCAEGDNRPNGIFLANYLNKWLELLPEEKCEGSSKWIIPSSWVTIERPPPEGLY